MSSPDIVVVGGGPAGSAAAARAAAAGAHVMLIERRTGPHDKVCGEFVSADAARSLRDLGLIPALHGAVPVERLRLICGRRCVEASLPFSAESLSRRILDEELLRIAASRGTVLRRGLSARSVVATRDGVRIVLSDGSMVEAGALFLASGKHDLRGHRRGAGIHNGLIGFKMHLDVAPSVSRALDGAVALLLFAGGYAGLQPLGEGRVNLCLVVTQAHYRALDRSWARLLQMLGEDAPVWRAWLAEARPLWSRPLSIAALPYGHVAGVGMGSVFRLGDQMAVMPSFAGDGIAMALRSARLAVATYRAHGADAAIYHRRVAREFGLRVHAAAWTSRMVLEDAPWLQGAVVTCAGWMPGLLSYAAAATRLGDDDEPTRL